jgi:hypothetical protein
VLDRRIACGARDASKDKLGGGPSDLVETHPSRKRWCQTGGLHPCRNKAKAERSGNESRHISPISPSVVVNGRSPRTRKWSGEVVREYLKMMQMLNKECSLGFDDGTWGTSDSSDELGVGEI